MLIAAGILGLSWCVGLSVALPTPVRLSSDAEDVYALRSNPAGLGYIEKGELRLLFGRALGDPAADGAGTNALGAFGALNLFDLATVGASYASDFLPAGRSQQRATLGFGFRASNAAMGVAWDTYDDALGASVGTWTLGASTHLAPWLSSGITLRDLGQKLGPRSYDLGVAMRLFSDRVLLSGQWRILQGESVEGETLRVLGRAEVEPLDGLLLGFGVGRGTSLGTDVTADLSLDVFGSLTIAFERSLVGSTVQRLDDQSFVSVELAYQGRAHPSLLAAPRVAVVELEGDLRPEPSFDLFSQTFEVTPYGALPLAFDGVRRSDRAIGMFVRIGSLSVGWAKAQELRAAIGRVREARRRVDCELTGSGDLEYFIASACSSILISPATVLSVNGVAANVLFFADGLERLGVEVDVARRGAYKSTPEQFTRSGMSAPQREALGGVLDAVYGALLDGIAEGRRIPREEVERWIERGTITATEAVSGHFVDALVYPDEIEAKLNEHYGRTVAYVDASEALSPARPRWGRPERVAVLHVDGPITGGESRNLPFGFGQTVGAATLVAALDAASSDPTVAAIVLRVDSPGGDSLASDLIARAVRLANEKKPVVASFGDIAASGGYYIAAGARSIYAEPTTVTGSIGVFSLKVSIEQLLNKLGISADSVERGRLSNATTSLKDTTPEELAVMEREVGHAYDQFLEVVAKGRKLSVARVRELAEGRVWSGLDAMRHGLVDGVGGMDAAITRARVEAGLDLDEPIQLVNLPGNREQYPEPMRVLMGALSSASPPTLGLADLVPHGLLRAFAMLVVHAPGNSGWSRPLALTPFVIQVD